MTRARYFYAALVLSLGISACIVLAFSWLPAPAVH